jgi:hypothetical protein
MDFAENKSRLEARLKELEGRLSRIEHDLALPLDADSSERAIRSPARAGVCSSAALAG